MPSDEGGQRSGEVATEDLWVSSNGEDPSNGGKWDRGKVSFGRCSGRAMGSKQREREPGETGGTSHRGASLWCVKVRMDWEECEGLVVGGAKKRGR